MKLSQILSKVPVKNEYTDLEIGDLIYDSRKVTKGCAFVCLKGAASDGHLYAREAGEKGAAVIIAEHEIDAVCPVVIVEDTRAALAQMSAAFFEYPAESLEMIGITGTKGKTTVSYMIESILKAAGRRVGVIGTVGVVIGEAHYKTNNTTPESYEVQRYLRQMVDAGCSACVMEVSSIGLRDHRVDGITFDIGIFTNLSEDHIGGSEHKDMDEYLRCKAMLFERCRYGVINTDDPSAARITENAVCVLSSFGFGAQADFRAQNDRLLSKPGFLGVAFTLLGKLKAEVEVSIPGKFSVYNALAAIGACSLLGVPKEAILSGLGNVKAKGRVEPVAVPGNYTLLIDYAHNAISMQSILETLREYHPKRLICLFGAGGNRPKIRRYEMGEVSGRLADLSVITADNSRFEDVEDILRDIETGLAKTSGTYIKIPDRREAIRYCLENARDGDIIVLAGKGHEDYQEIRGVKYPFDERVVVAELLEEMKL